MGVKKRTMLCIKKKDRLDLGHLLLYDPYKNILSNFLELAIKKGAKNFDPVAKVYHGLLSAPPEIREYYEALIGVTSYYQASKGGRGRYIEKKLASSFDFCSLDIKLSQIPFWLTHPNIHKKSGIFTQQGLSPSEKGVIRRFNWDWTGEKDEETDLGYRKHEIGKIEEFTFGDMLLHFDIHCLEMYVSILFDITDAPATIETDKTNGFYSSSKEGFNYLASKVKDSGEFNIVEIDSEKLHMIALHNPSKVTIKCGALYGDEVTEKLFRRKVSVSDLLLLRYDDIWLSQLIAISERAKLLKFGNNYITIFKQILAKDWNVKKLYDE